MSQSHWSAAWAMMFGALLAPIIGTSCTQTLDFDSTSRDQRQLSSCDEYCDVVMSVCDAANTVYLTRAVCLGVCDQLARVDSTSVNAASPARHDLVSCRKNQAELAARTGEPAVYCPRAGPAGNACGSNCENYCALLRAICPDESAALPDCERECAALPDRGTYSALHDQEGDTVQCRLAHLSSASVDPETHCPHARIVRPVLHCQA